MNTLGLNDQNNLGVPFTNYMVPWGAIDNIIKIQSISPDFIQEKDDRVGLEFKKPYVLSKSSQYGQPFDNEPQKLGVAHYAAHSYWVTIMLSSLESKGFDVTPVWNQYLAWLSGKLEATKTWGEDYYKQGRAIDDFDFIAQPKTIKREGSLAMLGKQQSLALNNLPQGQDWVLEKEGKRVVIPYEFLDGLHQRTLLARKLNVEFNTRLYVKDGRVTGISPMPDEKKIALIEYQSRDEKEVTEDAGLFITAWVLLEQFKRSSQEGKELDVDGILKLLEKVSIKFYSHEQQQWVTVDHEDMDNLEEFFQEVIDHIETVASTPMGSMSLIQGSARPKVLGEEVIEIHNHPNGNPSPPSAIDKKKHIGDIYLSGFFSGVMQGLILDTAEHGEQLYFFHEPNDQREADYVHLYNLYWWKDGDPANGQDATVWHPDIRMHSRSVNEGKVLERLKRLSVTMQHAESLPSEAMLGARGGIDFTPARMKVEDINTGQGIKFHLDPTLLKQLQNAPGFVPVIINIQPMRNLEVFLGLAEEKDISNHS